MARIALCDNEPSDLEGLRLLLDQYGVRRGQEMEAALFSSPLELLAAMERGVRFDLLLLDILMPGQSGIEAAREIRQHGWNARIIFLSSSPEFGVQAYGVEASQYLLKPVVEETLFPVLDAVLDSCKPERAGSFLLRCKGGIVRIEPARIEYGEICHRKLLVHMASGRSLESTAGMDELMEYLSAYGCFLRVHRSYFVNMDCIQQLSYRAIILSSGAKIPIPRGRYNELKNLFLEYATRKGQVLL